MIDPYKLRKDFPMYRNNIKMQKHDLVFLDNASTTFKPDCVLKAVEQYYNFETSNAHRGDYDLCFNADKRIEETRGAAAKLIGANSNEVVFTSGASMSINLIAYGYCLKYLKKDDEILITEAEHASNVLPWFKIHELIGCKISYIPLEKDGKLTPENVEKAITKNTKIIAIAQVTNVLGYTIDVKKICQIAHKHGILVACDGAQSVPHMEINVKDLDVDFLSFSAHKMCGPTGVGVLYGKYELLKKMDPLMSGGGMNAKFDMCGEVKYLDAPAKFEAGTLNLEGIFGFKAAIEYIQSIGRKNIHEYEIYLRKYTIEKMKEVPNIVIYNENADSGIITFNIKGVFAQDEATFLNYKGIAVRSGQHCAKILVDFLHEVATIRVSLYFYTTKEDIDYLVECLKEGGDFLDAYFA